MRINQKPVLAVGTAAVVALVLAVVTAPPNLEPAVFVGLWFALIAAVKGARPQWLWGPISWLEFVVTGVVGVVGAILLFNPTILGGWTLIVLFGLFILYGLWRLIIAVRRGDGSPF